MEPDILSTIDVEFWEVEYINLPDSFVGLELTIAANGHEKFSELGFNGRVFQLKCGSNVHYVVAAGCTVGESDWDYDKSRLMDLNLSYKQVLASL
jgi:hypothetical protein